MSQFPPPLPPIPPLPPQIPYQPPSLPGSGSGGSLPTDTFPDLLPPTIPGPLAGNLQAHRASTILGLGIAALAVHILDIPGVVVPCCCCGGTVASVALGIPTLVMANTDIAAIRAERMDPNGLSSTRTGRTCAIIALVLAGLSLIGGVVSAIVQQTIMGGMGSGGGQSPFGP